MRKKDFEASKKLLEVYARSVQKPMAIGHPTHTCNNNENGWQLLRASLLSNLFM